MNMRDPLSLPRHLQIGPCRVEWITPTLLRISGGGDQAAVVAALRRAGGELDCRRKLGEPTVWWVPARRVAWLRSRLGRVVDPLFR